MKNCDGSFFKKIKLYNLKIVFVLKKCNLKSCTGSDK
jgi:hypothetical protein